MLRNILLLLLATGLIGLPAQDDPVAKATVKIHAVSAKHDHQRPWSMHSPRRGTGSGCVIDGQRILTNAHVVANTRYLQVQRYGDARKWEASVIHVIHDADLALVAVKDPAFFEGVTPLPFADNDLPEPQSDVVVHGFPTGGTGLSITKGVVSRIEAHTYVHSGLYLMAVQIDAPINPGNSGGPVTQDGHLIGVVMQGYRYSDGIGYLVPMSVVRHVLKDLADGTWGGFPSIGIGIQHLENPHHKAHLGLPPEETGILVRTVVPDGAADGHLQPGDVLLSVDGIEIADDGTTPFLDGRRIYFSERITRQQIGTELTFTVWRDGAAKELSLALTSNAHDTAMVPLRGYEKPPRYFIYGGLVLSQLTTDYLMTWGSSWRTKAPAGLVAHMSPNWKTDERREIVVLQRVLPGRVNQGYHSWAATEIQQVDGVEVRDLAHAIELIEQGTGDYLTLTAHKGYTIALERAAAKAENAKLLKQFRIAKDRSADLR